MSRAIVPIANISRRLPEAGRIRIGVKSGKAMRALNTFRFTSHDEEALRQIAAVYGGTVRPWSDPKAAEGQFEVITEASEIRIVLPPDPLGGTPIYEMWGGGGCERRCDGLTAQVITKGPDGAEMIDVPCVCSAKGAMACDVKTRLTVMLPEVRFGGVWRLESKSWNVAQEMPGMVGLIQSLQERGLQRGVLALKHRRSVTAGETHKFIVPVLGVDDTLEALAAGAARLGALPAAGEELKAIGAGSEEGGDDEAQDRAAVEGSVVGGGNLAAAETSTDDVTDATVVPELGDLRRRLGVLPSRAANAARKRARDFGFAQIEDGEPDADDLEGWDEILTSLEAEGGDPEPISEGQMRKLNTVLQQRGHVGPLRHEFASKQLGREVTSLKELSAAEANHLIGVLEEVGQ